VTRKKNKKKVAVAMSGGVDSSVAAFLLRKKYDIFGLTMYPGPFGKTAVKNARIICRKLKIHHYVVNLEKEFKKEIIRPFCREYLKGKTPNPCIWCNNKIKFGLLLSQAKKLGADYLATGHYARLRFRRTKSETICRLLKSKDKTRDQSYFLYRLRQSQLKKIIFPLGDLTKNKVKEIAMENNLIINNQKESREICFIPNNDYRCFLRDNLRKGIKKGLIEDGRGVVIGEHQGLPFYTIGQRKGLLNGERKPVYVTKIDYKNNTLIVGRKNDLYRKEFTIENVNWLHKGKTENSKEIKIKIRYRHPAASVEFFRQRRGRLDIKLKRPQRAVTPGQSAVFYQRDQVLGGGIIIR